MTTIQQQIEAETEREANYHQARLFAFRAMAMILDRHVRGSRDPWRVFAISDSDYVSAGPHFPLSLEIPGQDGSTGNQGCFALGEYTRCLVDSAGVWQAIQTRDGDWHAVGVVRGAHAMLALPSGVVRDGRWA